MADSPITGGWTNTDDEAPSVRITTGDAPVTEQPKKGPTVVITKQTPDSLPEIHKFEKRQAYIQPNPHAMRMSAVAGIAIVIIAVTMYIGIDTLRGSLTESGGTVTTITMTTDNQFSPATVTVAAGTTLSLENKNPSNPQVLKVKAGSELFPTQVIFDKPYTFTIPTGISGTFIYTSETMPQDRTLTITVTPAIEAAASSVSSSVSAAQNIPVIPSVQPSSAPIDEITNVDDFPLPFGGPMHPAENPAAAAPTAVSVAPQIASSSSSNVGVTIERQSDTTQIISVGGTQSSESNDTVTFASGEIPTNPYTVANAKRNGGASQAIAQNMKNLHNGAPLLAMRQYRATRNTSTGPAAWGIFLSAILLMFAAYRKGLLS